MDKLKRLLAEAEAALEARKKPPEDTGHRVVGEGLVIDEWVKKKKQKHIFHNVVIFNFLFHFQNLDRKFANRFYLFSERAKREVPCSAAGGRGC